MAVAPLAFALLGAGAATSGPSTARVVTHALLDARVMGGSQIPHGPMAYLVTPTGHMFRTLGQQPILDEDGTKLGLLVSYVGDTRDPEAAAAKNAELMKALGLDAQVMNMRAVLIQDRVGFDPRKPFNTSVVLHASYGLQNGRWTELPKPPRRPDLPKTIGTGPLEVIDDPEFPFDRQALAEAAQLAHRWVLAVDAVDFDRMHKEMSERYFSLVTGPRQAEWEREMTQYAQIRHGAPRRELYRLQHRSSDGGIAALVTYEVDLSVSGMRALEPVTLNKDLGHWRVTGYGFFYPKERDRSAPESGTDKRP
jgi:hypothetical protein